MDKAQICRQLPEEPPAGLIDWTEENCGEEIGARLMIVNCERRERGLNLEYLMCDNMVGGKKEWAAVCECSVCTEEFVTAKLPGVDAIEVMEGPDGLMYPWWDDLEAEEFATDNTTVVQVAEGDGMICPFCLSDCKVVFGKKVRGGRSKRMMVAAWLRVGAYVGICYWMVEHRISRWGSEGIRAVPREAFLRDENGRLQWFGHWKTGCYGTGKDAGAWRPIEQTVDTSDKRYSDWGSINSTKVGTEVFPDGFDTEGTTAEKTGLQAFVEAGGWPAARYLKLHRTAPGVENLLKAGVTEPITRAVRDAWRFESDPASEAAKYIDITKVKPHEMLRMTKRELRMAKLANIRLTADLLTQWAHFRKVSEDFLDFLEVREKYGATLDRLVSMVLRDGTPIARVSAYMERQQLRYTEVGLLDDARKAYKRLAGARELTDEELWPRQLRRAHDAATLAASLLSGEGEKYQKAFENVRERFGALEWTDGEFCILLPKAWIDLQWEGQVLRHCVGMYGKEHANGSDTIFFVRRYRRPERPYYTLDIDMRGEPKEKQLHGYGNERHGPNKEYPHKLDKRVRAFCDRWKREVLMPFYIDQKQKEKSA